MQVIVVVMFTHEVNTNTVDGLYELWSVVLLKEWVRGRVIIVPVQKRGVVDVLLTGASD